MDYSAPWGKGAYAFALPGQSPLSRLCLGGAVHVVGLKLVEGEYALDKKQTKFNIIGKNKALLLDKNKKKR